MTSFDSDADNLNDSVDNCPKIKNSNQDDFDKDLVGDSCDH